MTENPTVVIADDSPTLRRVVSGVLEREGFRVVVAEDGMSAVQAVFRTQPDAVVMDVQMPRLSGYVAARLLKEDWSTKDIPVALLTSLDSASDRYWGDKAGADRYLTKDFESRDLAIAVRSLIDAAARKPRRSGPAAPRPGRAQRRRRARAHLRGARPHAVPDVAWPPRSPSWPPRPAVSSTSSPVCSASSAGSSTCTSPASCSRTSGRRGCRSATRSRTPTTGPS